MIEAEGAIQRPFVKNQIIPLIEKLYSVLSYAAEEPKTAQVAQTLLQDRLFTEIYYQVISQRPLQNLLTSWFNPDYADEVQQAVIDFGERVNLLLRETLEEEGERQEFDQLMN